VWSGDDVALDFERVGLNGSPTKVLEVHYVSLAGNESREIAPTPEGIAALMRELVQEYNL